MVEKIISTVRSCTTFDQLHSCRTWIQDLCWRALLDGKEGDVLLKMVDDRDVELTVGFHHGSIRRRTVGRVPASAHSASAVL